MKCFHPALSSFTPFHTQNIFCQTSCQPDWWPVYKNCRECYITTFQWRILDKLLFFFLCFLKISLRPSLNGQTVFLKAFPPHWCTNSHQISVCNVIKMWTALHDVFFFVCSVFSIFIFCSKFYPVIFKWHYCEFCSLWRGPLLKYWWCFCCGSLFRSLLFHSLHCWKYCSVYRP